MIVRDKNGEVSKLPRAARPATFCPSIAILSVEPGEPVEGRRRAGPYPAGKRQDPRHHRRSAACRRAVRGPASEGPCHHRRISGPCGIRRDYKNKRRIRIVPPEDGEEPRNTSSRRASTCPVQEGDFIEKGEYILDGNPAPHDILAIKGVEELATYLVNEDPGGLPPAGRGDQRQAHRSDRPPDAAEGRDQRSRRSSTVLSGEQLDRSDLREASTPMLEEGKKPAGWHAVLLGITKASLQTRRSSRRPRSRKPPAFSPKLRCSGKVDTWKASRRTSSWAA